ncbi:hypothetical protein Q1695_006208 [Nippostrongylus brasiliensis]|nr:hypothetical protein Q1695_006208 [Nippostrongylus brasiliensis]
MPNIISGTRHITARPRYGLHFCTPLPMDEKDNRSKYTITPNVPPDKVEEARSKSHRPGSPQEKSEIRDLGADKKDDHVFDKDEEKTLKQFEFYHGFLPREDLYVLVRNVGDFLLRVSEVDNDPTKIRREIILSVSIDTSKVKSKESDIKEKDKEGEKKRGKLKNVIIRRRHNKYLVESTKLFDTLALLMDYYQKNPGKLNKFSFALTNPIKLQPWEFLHSDVKPGNLLGQGAFGEVRDGTLTLKTGEVVEVAIKVTKGSSDLCKAKIKEMMKEARLMRNFKHKNIVRIYGVAVDEQPLYILLELITGGALNSWLKANAGKVPVPEKTLMCYGAAQGVEYLHMNCCMHRDLAARNCLITADRVVKISDFGLSRMGTHYQIRKAMRLPIKWLAPETITTFSFSLKSDVFSFGVVVFEIFSDGEEPWTGKTNKEVKVHIVAGEFLSMPECLPDNLRNFINDRVFVKDPAERADMTEVVKVFEQEVLATSKSEMSGWFGRDRRKNKLGGGIRSMIKSLAMNPK